MAAFSLRLDLAKKVNRHFLENDYDEIDTPRDFVEDTCSMGKLLMVRDGLSDK